MFSKTLVTVAALGVVSMWYLRSRTSFAAPRVGARHAPHDAAANPPPEPPNIAERMQHSHAMGVAGGIEMQPSQQGAGASSQADAQWPASREFLRGA